MQVAHICWSLHSKVTRLQLSSISTDCKNKKVVAVMILALKCGNTIRYLKIVAQVQYLKRIMFRNFVFCIRLVQLPSAHFMSMEEISHAK